MPVRVECSTPGLEANWVEFGDVWSRRELREYIKLKGDEFVELWRRKVTAVNLVTVEGEVITDPMQVHARLDDLDIRMMSFATDAGVDAVAHLMTLGEANRRLSSNGDVAAQTTTKATPSQ